MQVFLGDGGEGWDGGELSGKSLSAFNFHVSSITNFKFIRIKVFNLCRC